MNPHHIPAQSALNLTRQVRVQQTPIFKIFTAIKEAASKGSGFVKVDEIEDEDKRVLERLKYNVKHVKGGWIVRWEPTDETDES